MLFSQIGLGILKTYRAKLLGAAGGGALMLEMQNIRHCRPDAGIDAERWITGIISRAFPRSELKRSDWGLVDITKEREVQKVLQAAKEAAWEEEKKARLARRAARLAQGQAGTPSRQLKRTRSDGANATPGTTYLLTYFLSYNFYYSSFPVYFLHLLIINLLLLPTTPGGGTNWRKRLRRTLSTPAKSSTSSSSAAGDAATPGRSVGLFASLQNWLTPGKTPRVKKRYTPAASSSAAVAAACVVQGVVLGSAVDASGKRKRRRNPLSEVQVGDAKVPTPVEMKVMSSRKRMRGAE